MSTRTCFHVLTISILSIATACTDRTMDGDGDLLTETDDVVGDESTDTTESGDTESETDSSTTGTDDDETDTLATDETESDETDSETDASDTTSDTGEPDPQCWTFNGYTWCTVAITEVLLLPTDCESDPGPGDTGWPYECAAGQFIDSTGWDDAWCDDDGCWGLLDGSIIAVLPECVVAATGAISATKWPAGYCTVGEQLPGGWDEWRCGTACFARIGNLWTTPMPTCQAAAWLTCEP